MDVGAGALLVLPPTRAARYPPSPLLRRETTETQSIEVLEIELLIRGYSAHLAWSRGDMRQVIKNVEEAHALLERRGGQQFLLGASRLYLSEHVAFRLASRGFELSEASTAADASEEPHDPIDRRELIRLLDLSIALLGGAPIDEVELRALRDKVLRLRAWLCMLEDEVDMATHSLNEHSSHAGSPEYMLLRCALLFRCNQPAEASAQTLEWIRSEPDLPYEAASDAVRLLCEQEAFGSALTAVNLLSERLAARDDCTLGSAFSKEYSDLQETKHRLLTESIPDSSAASEHIESLLDGHCAGKLSIEESSMRTFATTLWASGCEQYAQGNLHRAIESFERSYRFLEHARGAAAHARVQATLVRAQPSHLSPLAQPSLARASSSLHPLPSSLSLCLRRRPTATCSRTASTRRLIARSTASSCCSPWTRLRHARASAASPRQAAARRRATMARRRTCVAPATSLRSS
jgi:hypothetical protein